jgi:ribose transport system permease protein
MKNKFMKTKEISIFIALAILCLIMSVSTSTFMTPYNIGIIARQISFIAIVAIGQTTVLLTGGIDLSVGSTAGLSGILCSLLMTNVHVGPISIIFVSLVLGILLGCVNGILIGRLKLNAFIVTLAMGEIYGGLILVITRGYPILNLPESFAFLGQGMIGLVPVPVIFMLVITIVIAYLLENTPFGRNIYAVGGNSIAAKLAGIKVENVTLYVYMLSGMFASLSGLLLTSRMNAGQPTIGASWVMPSITAAIIGGTSLSGGEGTIIGTIIGAAFMGVLANGIVLLNISSYWERVITGAVVIIAVVIDLIRKIRSQKE